MKKIFSFLMAIAVLVSTHASTPSVDLSTANTKPANETPVLNANQIMLPVGNTGKIISLMALSEISVKDFQAFSGKKLSLLDKIGFKLAQRKLRNKIEADGTIKGSFLKKYAKQITDGETGFHFGGFALGFFLGIIGVLIAYLINDDYKSNRVKWAWIAFGIQAVLGLITILA